MDLLPLAYQIILPRSKKAPAWYPRLPLLTGLAVACRGTVGVRDLDVENPVGIQRGARIDIELQVATVMTRGGRDHVSEAHVRRFVISFS